MVEDGEMLRRDETVIIRGGGAIEEIGLYTNNNTAITMCIGMRVIHQIYCSVHHKQGNVQHFPDP